MQTRKKNLLIYSLMAFSLFAFLLFSSADTFAQKRSKKSNNTQSDKKINTSLVSGLKFRSIGPAYQSGRIADIAVDPTNHSVWYVGVASGNIWKTENNGITFRPIFDNYGSYSIGCLAIDPNNHNVIWAGTGENNHQRALGYGDGVYKSTDGGKTWKNMGLKNSRQIGMIAIDPRNSDVVFVAAEGSAWGPGGDRGLYKTTDGGKTWKKVLEISENTGVNNVVIDPKHPDIMYATSEQRRRHVFTKIGGGPESAVYKSTDGGETWRKLTNGLPSGHVGGMGIAISPVNTDVVYLIAEAEGESGGFFRSTDRGESWEKMSSHHSSGQYYNEIYCDPVDVNKVYSVETIGKVTTDGGKTWKPIGNNKRHVDDHALWIDPDDPNHFIIGTDGGIYITYDAGKNFRHVQNLPVTQYYRVYVDNAYPFYNVYGGTQDNNSQGGPSRNTSSEGVTACEWVNTVGGDGFWGRVDPKDPNIVYSEYQYGNIYRYDKKSGERLYIKPQPAKDELSFRWNWNAPFIISPHSHTRLYIAANKVFRSDDRGQSWTEISPDLTAQIDRNTWPVMGKYWSFDAVAKDVSTSLYGTIVSLDESPVKEGLIYVGTDDGLIQVTEDGGKTWRKISSFPGVPQNTYVSDVFASRFDENVVYASFDNRKRDDFKPYILMSKDKGKTWTSISNDLPQNGTVHTIEQDPVDKDLLFVGTEFGIFFSYNGGKNWVQLKSGIPTIAVRDIALQTRENDLVLATFGRGFYILDDYSPLRQVKENLVDKEAYIFPIKTALAYIQTGGKYGQGSTDFVAKNPPYGATFTYYLKNAPKSTTQARHEKEKKLFKEGKKIPQITWKQAYDEKLEEKSYLLFTITDADGNVIRKLTANPSKGIHRITWDLRYAAPMAVNETDKFNPLKKSNGGIMVMPGKYKVSMALFDKGEYKELVPPQEFEVKALNNQTLPGDKAEIIAFQKKVSKLVLAADGAEKYAQSLKKTIFTMKQTILTTPQAGPDLMKEAQKLEKEVNDILFQFEGLKPKASFEEIPPHKLAINRRLDYIMWTHYQSTANITKTEKEQFAIVEEQVPAVIERIKKLDAEVKKLAQKLDAIGAPWTPGRIPEYKK